MKRALRLALVAIPVAAAASSPWWAPPAGRRIEWFGAERVEVAGAHLLAPHEILRASGVRVGTNVWSDPAPFVAALRRHPAIADAEVVRVLPRTLRIRITEKTPAALVLAGTLRPATGDGEILSVDPAREPVDLPVLDGRVRTDGRGRVTDAGTRAALAEAARLGELEPALMARVSELLPAPGELRLILGQPALDVLVRDGMEPDALVRLRAAVDDVARRAAADTTHHGRPTVDARFDDQVVVRWQS
ncbi:cell division protein FtsQ/DivIB [Longimicrobium sp.]|uniref:cell division protein FtsQ/DivIB n=1 Tax=Longimicrobium sp. TaxID=2029185 RepID=UPI002C985760|nr:FtsQ-type POTRA domain-containing protein [Longimicrobium sp.]HSU15196.1 FtsQ-type POTRA domain-containing protein [Longimicrobium sp.]